MRMMYAALADLVVVVHLLFVGFVLLGGVLVWCWPRTAWLHVPAVIWGVAIEWSGAICPLTPLENWLRGQAGEVGYSTDFVAQYLLPILYPEGLTRETQILAGGLALVLNLAIYVWLWSRRRSGRV